MVLDGFGGAGMATCEGGVGYEDMRDPGFGSEYPFLAAQMAIEG